jgi:hypothetical protein
MSDKCVLCGMPKPFALSMGGPDICPACDCHGPEGGLRVQLKAALERANRAEYAAQATVGDVVRCERCGKDVVIACPTCDRNFIVSLCCKLCIPATSTEDEILAELEKMRASLVAAESARSYLIDRIKHRDFASLVLDVMEFSNAKDKA